MLNQKALAASVSAGPKTYVEDVFSTWLYTGNGSTQTITNGIDLAGEGGLVWTKFRSGSFGSESSALFDTERGIYKYLSTNNTNAQVATQTDTLVAFNSDGYSLGSDTSGKVNFSAQNYASWTFRKAAKFFDVVTFTASSSGALTVNHNLGAVPGTIIFKSTSGTSPWYVWHRSISNNALALNLTEATSFFSAEYAWGNGSSVVQPTSTQFTVYGNAGNTYVAYLFAHDAGGFGDSGSDSVVSCGSFTTDGSGNATVSLGWEPQWVLAKRSDASQTWWIGDVMRGMTGSATAQLYPNTPDAEFSNTFFLTAPTATGFAAKGTASATYIYIAIRRGPMKTPTSGTEVFSANAFTSSSNGVTTTGFPPDLVLYTNRDRSAFSNSRMADRLRGAITSGSGVSLDLMTESTAAEGAVGSNIVSTDNVSFKWQSGNAGYSMVSESFRRAPGFFDVVGYVGSGSARTVSHSLGVVPELMIVKSRSTSEAGGWLTYSSTLGAGKYLSLNTTDAEDPSINTWGNTAPTSSVFSLGTLVANNRSAATYIAYLFATCPGVSKVGSYTGTGTTLSVDCGFTAGSRLVLIKRTDSTGSWYVWDTARGIVSGNDPYLLLNSTAAEVTNTDYIDPLSSGFEISSTAPAEINANGGSYIFLAVA